MLTYWPGRKLRFARFSSSTEKAIVLSDARWQATMRPLWEVGPVPETSEFVAIWITQSERGLI